MIRDGKPELCDHPSGIIQYHFSIQNLAEQFNWNISYAVMAALMAIGVVGVLLAPREKAHHIRPIPVGDIPAYTKSYDQVRCVVMQGGQGEVKHWAFNDPLPRKGKYRDAPPTPAEYRKLGTRKVTLHPVTITQNARTSGGGNVALVPTEAMTVGPRETWKAETVSIWHPGHHDNPFGIRLTALMISKRIPDAAVPMSLLADHPNVRFSYLRSGIGSVAVEMH